MAITTLDGVVAGLANRKSINFTQASSVTSSSFWVNTQRTSASVLMSTPAVASAGGTLHTDIETGFFNLGTVSGTRYLAKAEILAGVSGAFSIIDRVWSCSGLNGTLTSAQSITGMPTLTRPDSNGTGLEMYIEVYSGLGATASTAIISYTNSSGVSGRTATVSLPSLPLAFRMYPVTLQAGDTGVKSVQSVTLASSTGTAGDFGVVLASPSLSFLTSVTSAQSVTYDFAALGLPKVSQGAALNFLQRSNGSGSAYVNLHFIDG